MAEYRDAKPYVVAWIDWFDNNLQQQQVNALHEYHALEISDCDIFDLEDLHTITTMEKLKIKAFNMGAMISVLEIK